MFGDLSCDLVARPRRAIERLLSGGISLEEILNFPENHFHQHRLWAGPATPKPPERRRNYSDRHKEQQKPKCKNQIVLGPENRPEHRELSLNDIDHEQWVVMDFDKRTAEHDPQ